MAEKVVIRQDNQFRTLFLSADPEDIHSETLEVLEDIHQLTPYGMLLSSLGSCTALVLHTYAQNHDIALSEVEISLEYQRVFREDCEDCDEDSSYDEEIHETLAFKGELSAAEREKLKRVAHYCPIYKMLQKGIRVKTRMAEDSAN
ncbi:MAG: putative redox protein [Chloroflexota bacterium]|nr:putative redox protein [Chloroflexota bacterium]